MAEGPPRPGSAAGWSEAGAPGAEDREADEGQRLALPQEERYQTGGELGAGGMGQVVAALDRRLQRHVALKRVAGEPGDAEGLERRLAREARITASLDHPAIVPIFDAGRAPDGALYYTMRMVRGRTLGDAITGAQGLPGRLALLRHFLLACEAVAYAHSRGVVHRDLKPDNILVGEFGEAQVADWGLALRLDEAVDRERGASLARAGGPGTPGYMSPEQAAAAPPDLRSDVYSLGVVLRQILSGEPPRRGSGGQALPRDTPRELVAICARAMAQAPVARYPDARALAADVERYLDGRRVAAHRYSTLDELRRFVRARRAPLAVGATALVLLVCLGLWALRRTGQERDRALAAERQARAALAAAAGSLQRMLVQRALAALKEDEQPEAEVAAASALQLGESPEARGVIAAFARARPRLLARQPLPRCERLHLRPDGALLCIEGGMVVSLRGSPLRERWRRPLGAGDATWLSPGRVVVTAASAPQGVVLAEGDGEVRGELQLGVPGVLLDGGRGAVLLNPTRVSRIDEAAAVRTAAPCGGVGRHLAAAADGGTTVVACWDGAVVFLGADGGEVRRLRTDRGLKRPGISALALTQDGGLLLFATLDGDVVALDARTGTERAAARVSSGVIRRIVPAPDHERVALITDRGSVALWNARTGAVLGRLPAGRALAAAWAAADELLVAGDELRRWSLPRRLPAAHVLRAGPPGLAAAELSADGQRLVIARGDGGVAVLDAVTGARIFEHRMQATVVIKGARFLADGGILAWSVGQPSLRRFSAAGAPVMTWGLPALRRAALLPGGWLVAVGYGRGAGLFPPALPAAPQHLIGEEVFVDAAQDEGRREVALLDQRGAVWLVRDGEPPVAWEALRRPGAHSVAVAAGGTLLAVAGEREGEVLDGVTGRARCRFRSDGQRIQDLALSPDGRLVAAGDLDRTARVWSALDGRLLAVLHGHEERIASVGFAAGLLVTASWDGSARLWDLGVIGRPAEVLRAEIEAAWGLRLEAAE